MTSAALNAPAVLPEDHHFNRNYIGNEWQFPAAPFEFEIRSPSDGSVLTEVPLSSRFEVQHAIKIAGRAPESEWADPVARATRLRSLVDRLAENQMMLGELQARETGLSVADSLRGVRLTLRVARSLLRCEAQSRTPAAGGVQGHILSWGLPFNEIVTAVLPALVSGDAVVVKPSLRGALSTVAFAVLASASGLPPGVVNIVQGTGEDVGAELLSHPGLRSVSVRAGERTISHAIRAAVRTGVPLHTLRAGGNVAIVGPHAFGKLDEVAATVATSIRVNSAGGPLGLPLLAVHEDLRSMLVTKIIDRLVTTAPAPLPTEPLRHRTLQRIDALVAMGGRVLFGGSELPDDVPHRMGWRVLPTVLDLGRVASQAVRAEQQVVPLGPVLSVMSFNEHDYLPEVFIADRAKNGIARIWGADVESVAALPHGLMVTESSSPDMLEDSVLPSSWTGGMW